MTAHNIFITILRYLALGGVFASLTLVAQQSSSGNSAPDAPSAARRDACEQGGMEHRIQLLRRRSVFFPNLATDTAVLSSEEKFELFVNNSISGASLLSAAAGAGIGQAADSNPGYGQGVDGFGKHFGANMAANASIHFFSTF